MATKADLINDAYKELRISGLTVNPTPEDITIALSRLEGMMAEWDSRSMNPGYYFEDNPDVNTESNVPRWAESAVYSCLAVRLCHAFGKSPLLTLAAVANAGLANVAARTAFVQQTPYPSRMPRGSGTTLRFNRYRRFFPPAALTPSGPDVKIMLAGEINQFQESWHSYLLSGEDISSFIIEAQEGLTILSSSLATPVVNYEVEAGVSPFSNSTNVYVVRITVTTTDGREDIRQIQFVINEPEQI